VLILLLLYSLLTRYGVCMSKVNNLYTALTSVHLGGTIENCVVTVEGGVAHVLAMDMSSSLFIEVSADVDIEDCQIGIDDLQLLLKYLNSLKDLDVEVSITGNRIVFKPEANPVVKFLLSEVDMIPSWDEEWVPGEAANEFEKYEGALKLDASKASEVIQMVSMFGGNISFDVSSRGVVSVNGGSEATHQYTIKLGVCKEFKESCTPLLGKRILEVLKVVDFTKHPVILLLEGEPVVIKSDNACWVLSAQAGPEADGEG